jgi:hypothetical protein
MDPRFKSKLTAAVWTLTARPLPRPPQSEYENFPVKQTIEAHPELFQIVMPINVDALERLTDFHPNCPFVESILEGLRCGFWPWANTRREGYPTTHDESRLLLLSPKKESFLNNQIQHERSLGRMSESFRTTLLPGMYCMPHYVGN